MLVKKLLLSSCFVASSLFASSLYAQETPTLTNADGSEYQFEIVKSLDRTAVENQGRSGTCWSFSTLSFFESEIKRISKKDVQLAPMFVVHHTYLDKADKYVRMHGNLNFSAGGAFHDVSYVFGKYGIVPKSVYTGMKKDAKRHDHGEMDAMLKSMVDVVLERKKPSTNWKQGVDGVLNSYLGELPTTFDYEGKNYTPKSFAKEMGLNLEDYVSITSYTHHPFYSTFAVEVPDNWMAGNSYNLPLDEMMEVMDNALKGGYSIAWGSDVSEKGFNYRAGLAVVPEDASTLKVEGKDNKNFSDAGAFKYGEAFRKPVQELEINQEMRQKAFDNYETTDDHGMQMIGLARDQEGNKFYVIKNSWGDSNQCDGYFYASEAFVKYKTMNYLVHKDAIPSKIRKKLGL